MQKFLVFKKESEDGPDVKGGELDALIVHATKVQKISENGKLILILHSTHTHINIPYCSFFRLDRHKIHTCFLSFILSFSLSMTLDIVLTRYHVHFIHVYYTQNYLLVWSKMVQIISILTHFAFPLF